MTAEATAEGKKLSAAEKRRQRRKTAKSNKQAFRDQQRQQEEEQKAAAAAAGEKKPKKDEDEVELEYVSAPIDLGGDEEGEEDNPIFSEFQEIFQKFMKAEELVNPGEGGEEAAAAAEAADTEKEAEAAKDDEGDADSDKDDGDPDKLSKKKRKMLSRLKIAELKQSCRMPEVVEVWDVTAQDPRLLVFLKSCRNTVPVPLHWSQKRKFLQGKRGIEKPIFQLPDFIEATGISEMRQAYQEKEDQKKLKQKQRDRMQPKMGKMDIDYQVLHDAFFKNQTRPKLTGMGELYYEGKEFEAQTKSARPGVLSPELKVALGMAEDGPPPWLINMQRYGPPPSYPALKLPGLNAPIPAGASFGYHPGGWGKPPVDEGGNPIYGDVFGVAPPPPTASDKIDKAQWGELESDEEESEEEESEEKEEDDDDAMEDGMRSVDTDISSLPMGVETPDTIQLRKGIDTEEPKALYTVLEQKATAVGGSLMGSDHTYVIPDKEKKALNPGAQKRLDILKSQVAGTVDVEVTLTPEEIEGLDDDAVKKLYAQRVEELKAANKGEDFSDMVAAKAVQQKRKAAAKEQEKAAKKQKEFKF
eukprot:jgi/Tetstr1/455279/TSEL_042115.t1